MSFKQLRSAYFKFPHSSPSGGTTTVLAPTEGAISITGQVANITLIIAAVVGAVTISGNTPTLTTTLQAVQGSVVIGGNSPSLSVGTILTPTEGAIVFGGAAPSLSSNLQPSEGSVVLGGQAPNLTLTLQASEGSVVIDGNAPSITQSGGGIISPTEGNIALVGEVPAIIQTSFPATSTGSGGGGRYFGYYPERAREVRAEIRSLTKEKKRIERRFKLAPNNVDLARLAELLTQLQQRLNVLIAEYEELIHVQTKAPQAQEEDELFLVNLFSRSFYND
jgi:hypothetical protein